ncbi:helix-turn-helix domain-containing protein [Streptomyces liliifuscus]|nr:helix-turn-helix transcriptional regulator [Streptomyces liliifuscus]
MGRQLQAERMRQNKTQEAVYLAAGVDRVTLQNIEAGRANPTVTTLLKIAHVLNVPLARLVDGNGPTVP